MGGGVKQGVFVDVPILQHVNTIPNDIVLITTPQVVRYTTPPEVVMKCLSLVVVALVV